MCVCVCVHVCVCMCVCACVCECVCEVYECMCVWPRSRDCLKKVHHLAGLVPCLHGSELHAITAHVANRNLPHFLHCLVVGRRLTIAN